MSIIDSLSAGYRFVTGRPYLLILPILLDFILWSTPRLSAGPLLDNLAEIYRGAAQMDEMPGDLVAMAEQASELISELGHRSNLLDLLVNSALFHVPSIMILAEPLPNALVREISNPLGIIALIVTFALAGVLIGVIYFGLLADRLPIGNGGKSQNLVQFLLLSIRRWGRSIFFILIVILILLGILIPIGLGVTVVALFSPPLASLLMALLSGLTFVALFYLYFSTAGLIMDDLSAFDSISHSVRLVRNCFWPTFGFIVLINLIGSGFGLIWTRITPFVPAGTIIAIVGNAYIGTGLAMALLVFYRTRMMKMEGDLTLEKNLDEV